MRSFLLFRRVLSSLLLCLSVTGSAWAQTKNNRQQATTVADANDGCLLLVCGAVTDKQMAVDTDVNTAAKVTSPLALAAASLRLQFPAKAQAGQQAGVALSSQTGLDVSVLGNVRVRTYLSTSGSPNSARQDFTAASLLTVASLSSAVTMCTFPVTAEFDQLEVQVSGLATASYTVRVHYAETYSAQLLPLPVTLTSFTGQASGSAVELAWQTASEENASHFVVERSPDGKAAFVALGQVPSRGAGTGPQSYQFRDAGAAGSAAPTLYYRLRQVDRDGQTTFSPVLVVASPKTPGKARLQVYPNPVAAGAPWRLSGAGPDQASQRVLLYSSRGELLYQASAAPATAEFQTPQLATGLYLVVLVNEQGQPVAQQRLVVQN